MFFKNYALLFLLSINFLSISLRVNGLRVLPETNSEDGSKNVDIVPPATKKTIKTKYGDIIDCFDINRQPAFDHPLLKNHKIQEIPNFPIGWTESSSIGIDLEHFGFHQECPQGTVPIRRTTSKMSRALAEKLTKTLSNNKTPQRLKMGAAVRLRRKDTRYVAARARIDIRNPKCKANESSSANIWFLDGHNQYFNLLLAGWAVNPTLYGDGNTHLSTFWADRVYDTGCYDMICPGFVQVDRVVPLGTALPSISVPDGPKYHITLSIFQDPETKNWWLHFGETNTAIGYWPNKIFSHFSNGASRLDLGGFVEGFSGQPKPQMGSGILPDGTSNYKYVSYFSKVEYIGQDNVTRSPIDEDVELFHDGPYRVEFHPSDPEKGANFLYGGPNSLKFIISRQSDDNVVKEM